jgi:BTB/POZ domain-containing protein KCTD9
MTWLWLLGAVGILYLVKVAIVMILSLMERRSRHTLSDMLATVTERPVATAFLALAVSVILVVGLTILFFGYDKPFFGYGYDGPFLQNIMVEAHGMVLDILVIGLFILWLNKLGEKRLENKRYQDEIDDFRAWKSEEAAHRIAGSIKRLNRNGVSLIDLSDCYLARANLRQADFSGADLRGAIFTAADLRGADLWFAHFLYARLEGANFRESKNLTEIQIQSAYITRLAHV